METWACCITDIAMHIGNDIIYILDLGVWNHGIIDIYNGSDVIAFQTGLYAAMESDERLVEACYIMEVPPYALQAAGPLLLLATGASQPMPNHYLLPLVMDHILLKILKLEFQIYLWKEDALDDYIKCL